MLKEDNSGFVQFPQMGKMFNRMDTGKTFIYLVAFDSEDLPQMLGRSTKELAALLGAEYERELVHRDDLVLI